MRIGIFGGSFNPIHSGHIALARQLRLSAGLDEVWLMVSPQNPLKQAHELLTDQLRFQLARIALHNEAHIKACDYEFALPRPSYTWNTLTRLQADYPTDEFCLMIGGDNWQNFHRWYHADDIVSHHRIIVYPREGSDIDASILPSNVVLVKATLLPVSSTEIREKTKKGHPLNGMVPKVIEPLVRLLYK